MLWMGLEMTCYEKDTALFGTLSRIIAVKDLNIAPERALAQYSHHRQ